MRGMIYAGSSGCRVIVAFHNRHDHGSRASFPVYRSMSLPCQASVMPSREGRA